MVLPSCHIAQDLESHGEEGVESLGVRGILGDLKTTLPYGGPVRGRDCAASGTKACRLPAWLWVVLPRLVGHDLHWLRPVISHHCINHLFPMSSGPASVTRMPSSPGPSGSGPIRPDLVTCNWSRRGYQAKANTLAAPRQDIHVASRHLLFKPWLLSSSVLRAGKGIKVVKYIWILCFSLPCTFCQSFSSAR